MLHVSFGALLVVLLTAPLSRAIFTTGERASHYDRQDEIEGEALSFDAQPWPMMPGNDQHLTDEQAIFPAQSQEQQQQQPYAAPHHELLDRTSTPLIYPRPLQSSAIHVARMEGVARAAEERERQYQHELMTEQRMLANTAWMRDKPLPHLHRRKAQPVPSEPSIAAWDRFKAPLHQPKTHRVQLPLDPAASSSASSAASTASSSAASSQSWFMDPDHPSFAAPGSSPYAIPLFHTTEKSNHRSSPYAGTEAYGNRADRVKRNRYAHPSSGAPSNYESEDPPVRTSYRMSYTPFIPPIPDASGHYPFARDLATYEGDTYPLMTHLQNLPEDWRALPPVAKVNSRKIHRVRPPGSDEYHYEEVDLPPSPESPYTLAETRNLYLGDYCLRLHRHLQLLAQTGDEVTCPRCFHLYTSAEDRRKHVLNLGCGQRPPSMLFR